MFRGMCCFWFPLLWGMGFADGVVDYIRIGARRGLSMRSCRRIIGGRFAMRLRRCRWGSNGLCVCVCVCGRGGLSWTVW